MVAVGRQNRSKACEVFLSWIGYLQKPNCGWNSIHEILFIFGIMGLATLSYFTRIQEEAVIKKTLAT